jgi:hypothetical protein
VNDKVVFLEFRNRETVSERNEFVACKGCRNKTFVLVYEGAIASPLMKCSACGAHIGYVGWMPPEKANGA